MKKIKEEKFNFEGNNYQIVVSESDNGLEIVGEHESKIVTPKFGASHAKLVENNQVSPTNAVECLIETVKSDIEKLSMNTIR